MFVEKFFTGKAFMQFMVTEQTLKVVVGHIMFEWNFFFEVFLFDLLMFRPFYFFEVIFVDLSIFQSFYFFEVIFVDLKLRNVWLVEGYCHTRDLWISSNFFVRIEFLFLTYCQKHILMQNNSSDFSLSLKFGMVRSFLILFDLYLLCFTWYSVFSVFLSFCFSVSHSSKTFFLFFSLELLLFSLCMSSLFVLVL